MAEVTEKITVRRCDLENCSGRAVSTCTVCRSDVCTAHAAVFRGAVIRPIVQQKADDDAEPAATGAAAPRVEWEEVEKIQIELCWAHLNLWRAALKRAGKPDDAR